MQDTITETFACKFMKANDKNRKGTVSLTFYK